MLSTLAFKTGSMGSGVSCHEAGAKERVSQTEVMHIARPLKRPQQMFQATNSQRPSGREKRTRDKPPPADDDSIDPRTLRYFSLSAPPR